VLVAGATTAAEAPVAGPLAWEQWHSRPGVVDVAGPLSTGELMVAAGPSLFRVRRDDGRESELSLAYSLPPLAPPAGTEPYIAVPPQEVTGGTCPFPRDTVFALRPASPGAVMSIDPLGTVSTFTSLADSGRLNGITFDTVGRFGHRLVVTGGLSGGHTAVVAIDCHGAATTLTRNAPRVEGGLTIAPTALAGFGGDLIAPDEASGNVLAIDPSGTSTVIAQSGVPTGDDIGVEGVAFVPPGFLAGGTAYTADRGTPGNPHPGTDTVLRLPASAFAAAGVREGDMLLSTEASAIIVDIRCTPRAAREARCTARTLGMGKTVAHGEGHIVLVVERQSPAPTPSAVSTGGGVSAIAVAAAVVGGLAVVAITVLWASRWRRRHRA